MVGHGSERRGVALAGRRGALRIVVREEAVFDIGNGYLMDDYVMAKRV